MARLPKEPNDFDYGRRYYVSRRNFDEQQRMTTDKHIDNLGHIPHSETKKPYDSDMSYPEMEHFRFDLGEWPTFAPPELPPTEVEDLPDVPGERPRIEYNQTDPCQFLKDFTPYVIGPNEISRSKIAISENPLVNLTVDGPVKILTALQELFNCTDKRLNPDTEQITEGCNVEVQTLPNADEFNVAGQNLIPVTVTGTTKAGQTCEAKLFVEACPADFQYDYFYNPQTMASNAYEYLSVRGGIPPFSWTADGETNGWSWQYSTTQLRTNRVQSPVGACGWAWFTITDSCGTVANGGIRIVPSGEWVRQPDATDGACPRDNDGNPIVGNYTALGYFFYPTFDMIRGIDWLLGQVFVCRQSSGTYPNLTNCDTLDCVNDPCYEDVAGDCDDYLPELTKCITNAFLQRDVCRIYQAVDFDEEGHPVCSEQVPWPNTIAFCGESTSYSPRAYCQCMRSLWHYRWECPP